MYPGTDELTCTPPCDMDCEGCGMHDPCGYHFDDCKYLEPGDVLVSRATGAEIGAYDGPDLLAASYGEVSAE
jgi:hypothetical protein